MVNLTRHNLQYEYQWTAIPPDDPRRTGHPDDLLLNRNEGYEVLAFLSRTSETVASAAKAERMIRNHLPGSIRSRRHVLQWLIANWSTTA